MPVIHDTAVVAPGAELHETCEVGPYCVVGPHVRIGAGTRLVAQVFVDGHTRIGEACTVFPFASVGARTQDLKYKGGAPRLEVGDRTTIRESATLHAATADGDVTVVGSDCLLMAYAHVAHDCCIGDHVIIANCGTLAGHVRIDDYAIVGGLSGIHQFVRVGAHAIIGGCAKITQDVPPYMMADGNPAQVRGINALGLKRRGFSPETIKQLKAAYRTLYREDLTTAQAVQRLTAVPDRSPEVAALVGFVEASERGIVR